VHQEQQLAQTGNLELAQQLSQTLASSSTVCVEALKGQLQDLEGQMRELSMDRDKAVTAKKVCERRAAEAHKLERKLAQVTKEYEAARSANEGVVQMRMKVQDRNAELSKDLQEAQQAREVYEATRSENEVLQRTCTEVQARNAELSKNLQEVQLVREAWITTQAKEETTSIIELRHMNAELQFKLDATMQQANLVRAEQERRIAAYCNVAEFVARGNHVVSTKRIEDVRDGWSGTPMRLKSRGVSSTPSRFTSAGNVFTADMEASIDSISASWQSRALQSSTHLSPPPRAHRVHEPASALRPAANLFNVPGFSGGGMNSGPLPPKVNGGVHYRLPVESSHVQYSLQVEFPQEPITAAATAAPAAAPEVSLRNIADAWPASPTSP